eukprot:g2408.t1
MNFGDFGSSSKTGGGGAGNASALFAQTPAAKTPKKAIDFNSAASTSTPSLSFSLESNPKPSNSKDAFASKTKETASSSSLGLNFGVSGAAAPSLGTSSIGANSTNTATKKNAAAMFGGAGSTATSAGMLTGPSTGTSLPITAAAGARRRNRTVADIQKQTRSVLSKMKVHEIVKSWQGLLDTHTQRFDVAAEDYKANDRHVYACQERVGRLAESIFVLEAQERRLETSLQQIGSHQNDAARRIGDLESQLREMSENGLLISSGRGGATSSVERREIYHSATVLNEELDRMSATLSDVVHGLNRVSEDGEGDPVHVDARGTGGDGGGAGAATSVDICATVNARHVSAFEQLR